MSSNALPLIRLLAYVYVQNGAPARAEPLYAALRLLAPKDMGGVISLAWASVEAGKPWQALAVLDGLPARMRDDPLHLLLRARACARLERDDDARVAMQEFLALRARAVSVAP